MMANATHRVPLPLVNVCNDEGWGWRRHGTPSQPNPLASPW